MMPGHYHVHMASYKIAFKTGFLGKDGAKKKQEELQICPGLNANKIQIPLINITKCPHW